MSSYRLGDQPHLLVLEGPPDDAQQRNRLALLQIATNSGWFVLFTDNPHSLTGSDLRAFDAVVLSGFSLQQLPALTLKLLTSGSQQTPIVHLRAEATQAQLERFLRGVLRDRL